MPKPILKALLAGAVIAAFSPAAAGAGRTPHCGSLAFAQQSEDGAFRIVAHATSCATARSVAAASRPTQFRTGDPQYASGGFACAGRSQQLGGAGKQVVRFDCTRGHSSVSFLRG